MFKNGQYLYYNGKMCQVAQTQNDELIYIIIARIPFKRPDTIWVNMDEVKPLCPVCNEQSDFDSDGDILLCGDCADCKMEAADHADHLNSCDW